MDLNPLIVSFLLFTAMELGDKTQVAIVAMSMRDRPLDVFAGAIAAFAIVDGASIALGGFLASLLSPFWVNLTSGLLFLLLGLLCLFREEGYGLHCDYKCAFVQAFGVILLMELGDKTQLASMALSARYSNPLMVFIGAISAAVILTGCAVVVGRNLLRFIPRRYLRYLTSILFILFSLIFLMNALLGVNIF
jgi:putative Ca2+/H+ antiporter (TMEM165/GDT1 family)